MIKNLSFLVFFTIPFIGFSQCEVNENQAPFLADPVGSYSIEFGGDTLTAFPNATEGELYQAVVGVRIPNDTSFMYDAFGTGEQLFENVQINSISVNSVLITDSSIGATELPAGFSWDCVGGPATPNDCNWAGGDYGCMSFGFDAEVPVGFAGTHRLNVLLDVSATYAIAPGVDVPIDLTVDDLLNYYVLVIEEADNSSIPDIVDSRNFGLINISPNPARDYFNIQYGSNDAQEITIKIYDILGNLVVSNSHNSVFGYNEIYFNTGNLNSGIYTLTLSNHSESIIERVIID